MTIYAGMGRFGTGEPVEWPEWDLMYHEDYYPYGEPLVFPWGLYLSREETPLYYVVLPHENRG